jgi:hypothetical protein
LRQVAERLGAMPEFSETALNQLFQDLAAETGLKMVNLAQPVRGPHRPHRSPGLYEIINILERNLAKNQDGHRLCRRQRLNFLEIFRNSNIIRPVQGGLHMEEANQGYRKKQALLILVVFACIGVAIWGGSALVSVGAIMAACAGWASTLEPAKKPTNTMLISGKGVRRFSVRLSTLSGPHPPKGGVPCELP